MRLNKYIAQAMNYLWKIMQKRHIVLIEVLDILLNIVLCLVWIKKVEF